MNLTKNSFYEGLANTTELLDAQTFWQQAHSELIDAKINYKLKEVEYKKGESANFDDKRNMHCGLCPQCITK